MIYFQFLLGMVFYIAIASLSYLNGFKDSKWYIPVGMSLGLVTSIVWLSISKAEANPSSLIVKGLWWDAMLTLVYMTVPLLFFGARLNLYQWIGLVMVLLGLGLTKIG